MLGNWHVHFSPDVIQMRGGGFVDGLYIVMFIVSAIGAFVLGGWVAINYIKPDKTPDSPNPPPSPPTPGHHPHKPSGWGPGPWGPDPWKPDDPKPEPVPGSRPGHPAPKPSHPAPPDNFKPVLTLLSAKYDSVGRQIKVDYKILPSGSVPPSKSFSTL
jgi:hypothetical protein